MTFSMSKPKAITIIVVLSGLLFFIPYVLGYTLAAGDNLNQNIPLRQLATSIVFSGHLPLWNPLSWSGVPLLGGFNSGIVSPLTWLFGILPTNLAYLADMWITFSVGGIAFFLLCEECGASVTGAAVGAVGFIFTGQFASQSVHMDMIQGIAFTISAAYFGLKMFRASTNQGALGYTIGLGVSFAFVIVGGAPEAMLDGLFLLLAFLGVMVFDSDHLLRSIGLLALGAVIALTLSGAQWIPGLAFQGLSTRSQLAPNYFEAGPWAPDFLPTFLMPFSMGNFSAFGVPSYYGMYNLAEISAFIPSIFLFGAGSALISKRFNTFIPKARTAIIAVLIVGLILALGNNLGPLETLEAHIPLYHLQRLPSRNMFSVDFALCMLFGSSYEAMIARARRFGDIRSLGHSVIPFTASALSLAYLGALIIAPSAVFDLFSARSRPSGSSYVALVIMAAIEAVFVVGAAYSYTRNTSTKSRIFARLSAAVLILQIIDFSSQTLILQTGGYGPFADSTTFTASEKLVGPGERVGYFDPRLRYYSQLLSAGLPDLNLLTNTASVQGYSSLGIASYTNFTDSKPQLSFNPYLINGYAHQLLNLDVLFSGSTYFLTRIGPNSTATPLPSHKYQGSLPKATSTSPTQDVSSAVYLGGALQGSFITFNLPRNVPLSCLHSVSLVGEFGSTSFADETQSNAAHSVTFSATTQVPTGYELRIQSCGALPTINGAPDVAMEFSSPTTLYQINGLLSHVITPKLWRYTLGPYGTSAFISRNPMTTMLKAPTGVAISDVHTTQAGVTTAHIDAQHPFRLIRSEAYATNWKALLSKGTRVTSYQVGEYRTIQAVSLPQGSYTITFSYQPTSVVKGLATSGVGIGLVGLLSAVALRRERRNQGRWL